MKTVPSVFKRKNKQNKYNALKKHYFKISVFLSCGGEEGNPLQYSCLETPMDGGAWWAAVHGVAKSPTGLRDFPFTFHFHALEKEMATHSSVLAWRVLGTGSLVGAVSGVAQSRTRLTRLSSSSCGGVPLTARVALITSHDTNLPELSCFFPGTSGSVWGPEGRALSTVTALQGWKYPHQLHFQCG